MATPVRNDGWFLLLSFSSIMAILVYFNLDVSRLLTLIVKLTLVLAVLTYCIHLIKKIKSKLISQKEISSKYSSDEMKSKQSNYWLNKQEESDTKRRFLKALEAKAGVEYGIRIHLALSYEERIMKPRREAHLKKAEEEFRRFSGPVWKGKGYVLQGEKQEEETVTKRKAGRTGKDAISVRKLPDLAYSPSGQTQSTMQDKPQKRENKKITLPDEPPVDSYLQTITIGLRVPLGGVKRRRFLTSVTVQVILDWLTVEGYNTKIYTVCTSYPRKDLSESTDKTLQELGLVKDVILMVDEKGV